MLALDRQVRLWESEALAISEALWSREKTWSIDNRSDSISVHGRYGALVAYFASLIGQCQISLVALEQLGTTADTGHRSRRLSRHFERSGVMAARSTSAKIFIMDQRDRWDFGGSTEPEEIFEAVCEVRHLLAANEVLRDPEISKWLSRITEELARRSLELETPNKVRLKRSVRMLLQAYGLFPGFNDTSGRALTESHGKLFQIADLIGGVTMRLGGLNWILEMSNAEGELKELIKIILGALASAVHEGIDIFEIANKKNERLPWPIKGSVEDGVVMVIPGGDSGTCARILLAFASSKSKNGSLAPKKVMTQVQQAIIRCRGKLEAVIFVADLAAQGGEIQDHLPIMEDFLAAKDIKVFVPVTTMGRQLNALDWRA
jgi:hypothetical protein